MAGLNPYTGDVKGEVVTVTPAGLIHEIPEGAEGARSVRISNDYDTVEAKLFYFADREGKSIALNDGCFIPHKGGCLLNLEGNYITHIYLISDVDVDIHLGYQA